MIFVRPQGENSDEAELLGMKRDRLVINLGEIKEMEKTKKLFKAVDTGEYYLMVSRQVGEAFENDIDLQAKKEQLLVEESDFPVAVGAGPSCSFKLTEPDAAGHMETPSKPFIHMVLSDNAVKYLEDKCVTVKFRDLTIVTNHFPEDMEVNDISIYLVPSHLDPEELRDTLQEMGFYNP